MNTEEEYKRQCLNVIALGTLGLILSLPAGIILHEIINHEIDAYFGISSTISFGALQTTDCPWNCQPRYTATAWTSPNSTQVKALETFEPYQYHLWYVALVTNEGNTAQQLPMEIIGTLIGIWMIVSINKLGNMYL